MSEYAVQIALRRLPLSRASISALRRLAQYDHVVFTSKNARRFFDQELKARRITAPAPSRILQVGPRSDLLRFSFADKRILFPRSAIAPHDIVRRLRAKGAVVRVVPLYTARGVPLTKTQKNALTQGKVMRLYFASPSGIAGLLGQLRGKSRVAVLALPARCIGETTARAAKEAGFKRVFIR